MGAWHAATVTSAAAGRFGEDESHPYELGDGWVVESPERAAGRAASFFRGGYLAKVAPVMRPWRVASGHMPWMVENGET